MAEAHAKAFVAGKNVPFVHFGQQLAAQANTKHGFALLDHLLDVSHFRFQPWKIFGLISAHGPAHQNNTVIVTQLGAFVALAQFKSFPS